MTRYRITVTRLEENEGWAERWNKWSNESRYGYGRNEPEPQRFSEAPALTFEADDATFAAIRKAALEAMP